MREWIVTNGIGGYASLTYSNYNTRKFHGLLVASLNPPTERWVFVSNIFDSFQMNDKTYFLKNKKPVFNFDFFPSFTYKFDEIEIKKTIFMEHGKNTSIIKYNIETDKTVTMFHKPIVASRHFYDVNNQRYLQFQQDVFRDVVVVKPENNDKNLKLFLEDSTYDPSFYWDEFYYEKDHERNDSWIDNNIQLGRFQKKIKKPSEYFLSLSIENETDIDPPKIFKEEIQRKKQLVSKTKLDKKFEKLIISSDNFIVKKQDGKSIIAGYHWFGDWGRDTLIALPGLTMVTKRFNDAKQILTSFSKYCKNGLIPNAFIDRNSEAIYNTVDASLWYIDRVYQYLKYSNDQFFIEKIWDTLESIIDGYQNGTDYDIHMDDDHLISHGPGLTWMDVKIGDYYPTPRANKAVEIQALWYNALKIMSILANIIGKNDTYIDLSEKVKQDFNKQFDQQYDVIDKKDLSCRPNKIFLSSLDFSMINRNLQEEIVKDIQNKLVTIFGLRTLSPDDSRYKGSYLGDHNRDVAYHNGTVWPWLMGSFIKAFVKINNSEKQRLYAFNNFLKPMIDVFGDRWDGSIYEIFDGDPIYSPRGCVAQAWSVAEILRCWVEDIENIKPEYENVLKSSEICV